jgi:hypothetical protein
VLDQGRTVLDQLGAEALEGWHVLRRDTLERHKTPGWSADRCTAGGGIVRSMLGPGPRGWHLWGAQQAHRGPQLADLAPPLRRSTACCQADQTPGERGKKREEFGTAQCLPQDDAAGGIDTVERHEGLGQSKTAGLDCQLASRPLPLIMRTSLVPL